MYILNVIKFINYIGILFFPTWRIVLHEIEDMQSKRNMQSDNNLIRTILTNCRKNKFKIEFIKSEFHFTPILIVIINSFLMVVLSAIDKEIAPCYAGQLHLSHYLVEITMICFQFICSIGFVLHEVFTFHEWIFVRALNFKKTILRYGCRVVHFAVRGCSEMRSGEIDDKTTLVHIIRVISVYNLAASDSCSRPYFIAAVCMFLSVVIWQLTFQNHLFCNKYQNHLFCNKYPRKPKM